MLTNISFNSLLSQSDLNKYDSQGMHKVYDIWPKIATESYEDRADAIDIKNIEFIVFAGMGGSGAIGDIFSAILSNTDKHVSVVKGYLLPKTVDKNTLVITTSVSGNTVETLNILDYAKKLDAKIISFSSGGKMEKYCLKNKIEHKKIIQIHSPRASLTGFLYSMLKIMQPLIPVNDSDVFESIKQLENLQKQIASANLTESNPALSLAEWISNIPILYYPAGLQAAAIRFKNSLQENAKTHAVAEDVLEACHNGIVAWERQSEQKPILIQGEHDFIKTKERWKILKEYFEMNKIEYWEIFSTKSSILSKLIYLIYLLDYTSIYRGVLSKIDPSPVKSIDFVKQRLK